MKKLQAIIRGLVFICLGLAFLWLPSLLIEYIMTTWLAIPVVLVTIAFMLAIIYYIFKELVFGDEDR